MSDSNSTPTRNYPAPKWEVVNQETFPRRANNANRQNDHGEDVPETKPANYSEKFLVKLSQAHIAQVTDPTGKSKKFVETDFVHVRTEHKTVTDSAGTFTYNETAITPSDESGTDMLGYLYFAHRVLTLEEALFSIGEI